MTEVAIRVLLAGVMTTGSFGSAWAGGFQIYPTAASNGSAFAGVAANADDPVVIAINPALLAWFKKRSMAAGVSYVNAKTRVYDLGSSRVLVTPLGVRTQRSQGATGRTRTSKGIPAAAYVVPTSASDLPIPYGVALTSSYGLGTDYNSDWFGRVHALKSKLKTIDLTVATASAIDSVPGLSVGAGVVIQSAEAALSNSKGVDPRLPIGKAEISGDNVAAGLVVGLAYEPVPGTRVGVSYRGAVSHDLEGDLKISGAGPTDMTAPAMAKIMLPATMTLSASHDVNDRLTLDGTVIWTEWSEWKELRADFAGGLPSFVSPQNWTNSYAYSLGAKYRVNDRLTVKAGIGRDETPVPSVEMRTPRNPDVTKDWFAVGADWRINNHLTAKFGARKLRTDRVRMSNTVDVYAGLPPGVVTDHLRAEADVESAMVYSAQIRYDFANPKK